MIGVLLFLVSLLVVACGALWLRMFGNWWQSKPFLELEARTPTPWGLIDLVICFLSMSFGAATLQLAAMRWLDLPVDTKVIDLPATQSSFILSAGATGQLLGVAVGLGITALRSRGSLVDFGFSFRHVGTDIKLGFISFLLVAPPIYLIQGLLQYVVQFTQYFDEYHHPLIDVLKENPDARLFGAIVVSAAVVAPIAEEVLFRLLLQGWLERADSRPGMSTMLIGGKRSSKNASSTDDLEMIKSSEAAIEDENFKNVLRPSYWPMILSAALFAAAHYSHGLAPIPLFFLGLTLGYLYRQTHRILPCILLHALFNSCSLAMLAAELYSPK